MIPPSLQEFATAAGLLVVKDVRGRYMSVTMYMWSMKSQDKLGG